MKAKYKDTYYYKDFSNVLDEVFELVEEWKKSQESTSLKVEKLQELANELVITHARWDVATDLIEDFTSEEKQEEQEEINYGPVMIKKGKHKGILGYYDDDAWNENGEELAVVYLSPVPFKGEYVEIPIDYIEQSESEETTEFVKNNELFCAVAGIDDGGSDG